MHVSTTESSHSSTSQCQCETDRKKVCKPRQHNHQIIEKPQVGARLLPQLQRQRLVAGGRLAEVVRLELVLQEAVGGAHVDQNIPLRPLVCCRLQKVDRALLVSTEQLARASQDPVTLRRASLLGITEQHADAVHALLQLANQPLGGRAQVSNLCAWCVCHGQKRAGRPLTCGIACPRHVELRAHCIKRLKTHQLGRVVLLPGGAVVAQVAAEGLVAPGHRRRVRDGRERADGAVALGVAQAQHQRAVPAHAVPKDGRLRNPGQTCEV